VVRRVVQWISNSALAAHEFTCEYERKNINLYQSHCEIYCIIREKEKYEKKV
jgi:hypothetical protein